MSTLTVALLQTNIAWLDKAANLAALSKRIADLPEVDLVVLPETFATGFAVDEDCAESEPGIILDWLKAAAHKHNAVFTGSVLVKRQDKKANRFYWVWPDGRIEYYDKRHLFCLGKEGDHVMAGMERKIFTLKGFRLLPQVCYDLRFPVFQRNRNDYDVLVNVANWPAARRKVWDTLLAARAMENQSYVLGVNRVGPDGKNIAHSGGTVALDYVGEALASAEDDREDLLIVTLDGEKLAEFRRGFPAHLDADDFTLRQ